MLCDHRFYRCDHKIKFVKCLRKVAPVDGGFMLALAAPFIAIKDDSLAENKKARMRACGLFSYGKRAQQARVSAPARIL